MSITIPNMGAANVNDRKLLAPGVYNAIVCEVPVEKMSSNGNPQLEVTLEVMDGPSTGARLKDFIPMVKKSEFRVKRLLVCAGLIARDDTVTETFDENGLLHAPVTIKVTAGMYQGKETRNVEYVI